MSWLVFVLFFVSGACGLIYEVVWSRMMMLIFGRSTLAVGTVLAAFMFGLALGSYALGKYSDRSRTPLRLYALYEIGVSVTALIMSFLLLRITPVYVWVHEMFGEYPLAFTVIRFALAFALLIVPTFLMGATLPILSRVIVKRLSWVGQELGLLYAINTLGAVAGSLMAGFYLIGHLGLHGAINVAVIGNMTVGVIAWIASTRPGLSSVPVSASPSSSSPPPTSEVKSSDTTSRQTYQLVLWAFALSGLASFAYEIFWTRSLVFLLGSTTYAFTLMLTAFLLGIAFGGYGIRFFPGATKHPLRLFAAIEILIGVLSAIALPLLFFLLRSEAVHSFIVNFSNKLELLAVSDFVIALSVMLLPATLIGATLPLMGRIFISDLQSTGTTVGKIYAVNTLGNVVGALLPGLLIMPIMGIQKGLLLIAALNVGLGILLVLSRWKHVVAAVVTALSLFLVVAFTLAHTPISFQFPSEYEKPRDEVLFYSEGGLVTTKVWISADTGHKLISVDGINIGGTSDSDYKQQVLAHLPKLLLKSYRSELTIGLGSGILMGESARHASLKKIVGVEISHGVVAGARYFSEENFNILNDSRAAIIVDDIVDFLETASDRYDIISADEKTTGKYASNAFSYSKEYYTLLKRRLAPGGLVIQWVPTDLPPSQYALAVRTFLDSFPHVQLWYFPPVEIFTMTNTFLVGSNEPIDLDLPKMERSLKSDPEAFQGIRKYGLTTAEAVLAHFVGNEEALRRFIPQGPINSFEEPYYEFYSPRDYAVPPDNRTFTNHKLLMSMRGPDPIKFVRMNLSSSDANRLTAALHAEELFFKGHEAQLQGLPPAEAIQYYNRAIDAAPWNRNLRNEVCSYLTREYRLHYFQGEYPEATALIRRAAEIYPESSSVHAGYGVMLWKMNQTNLAVEELQQALVLSPRVVPVRRHLALLYASLGQTEKAAEQWKYAVALDPNDVPVLADYGVFLVQQGSDAEAVQYLRRAYQLDSEDPEVIDGYARVEYLRGNIAAARHIVLKGGQYYKGNPLLEARRNAILGEN